MQNCDRRSGATLENALNTKKRNPIRIINALKSELSTHSNPNSQRTPIRIINALQSEFSTHSNPNSQRTPIRILNALQSEFSTHSNPSRDRAGAVHLASHRSP